MSHTFEIVVANTRKEIERKSCMHGQIDVGLRLADWLKASPIIFSSS